MPGTEKSNTIIAYLIEAEIIGDADGGWTENR